MDTLPHRPFGRTGVALSPVALGGHEFLPDGRSRGFNEDMRKAVTPGTLLPGFGGDRRKPCCTPPTTPTSTSST